MKTRYYVIDGEENVTSYSPKADKSEFFTTEAAAANRANLLAESEPGKVFFICKALHFASCEVKRSRVQSIR